MTNPKTSARASRAIRLGLLMSTAALIAPTMAQAQAADDASRVEEVVVTGSRIVREGFQAPTPLSVIGQAQLETAATPNIAQYIISLPAFVGGTTTRTTLTNGVPSAFGTNSVNLRGLGGGRTLTLVDGHRAPPVHPSGQFDISSIPQQLITRVDVVTGGASAVYGSDAITGVVNFILDKTFTGLKGDVSAGVTNYGDGKNARLTLSAGTPFAGGRGHLVLSGEAAWDEGIKNSGIGGKHGRDRRWTNLGAHNILNPAYGTGAGQSTSVPQRLILTSVGYSGGAPGGVVVSGPLRGLAFGEGGVPYQQNYGDIVGAATPYMRGGDWAIADIRPWSAIAPSERRENVFARASFDVAEDVNVYAQYTWVQSRAVGDCCAKFMPDTAGPLIQIDNAFLPDAVRQRMVATGITSFRLGTMNQDLDASNQNTHRISITYQVGAEGEVNVFDRDWNWDIYAQRGLTNSWLHFKRNISRTRYAFAVDAIRNPTTGAITCRPLSATATAYQRQVYEGCSPWNAMGINVNLREGPAWDYIQQASRNHIQFRQDIFAGSFTGELFPLWAGPVSIAVAAEHRRDLSHAEVDAYSQAADHIYGNYAPIDGKSHVSEAAAEVLLPMAKDQPWAQEWNIDAAARYTDYSLSGTVVTWKLGTTYTPVDGVRFRATRSRDIRAPNHQELFQPRSTARNQVFDPFTNTSLFFSQVTVGNTELLPEKADTLGVGVVLQPTFLPGFSISADYWDIKLNDAIANVGTANVLNLCFNRTRPELCQFIVRDAAGVLVEVTSGNVNLAFNRVRGIDFESSYTIPLGDASSLRLHGNLTRYLEDYAESPITEPLDNLGTVTTPKYRYTASMTYTRDALTATLSMRGFPDSKINARYIVCQSGCPVATTLAPTANLNSQPGRNYIDASIQYRFNVADTRMTAYFNVRNIGNKDPGLPIFGNTFGSGMEQTLYDVEGTVFRAGIRFQM